MYRLLTGKFAFPGMTKMDRMVRRIQDRHVPITDVRQRPARAPGRGHRPFARLRPEDRFSSAAEVAEELEILLPVSDRRKRARGQAGKPPASEPPPHLAAEPETPLDWSLIESALQSKRDRARVTAPSTSGSSPGFSPAAPDPEAHRLSSQEPRGRRQSSRAGACSRNIARK